MSFQLYRSRVAFGWFLVARIDGSLVNNSSLHVRLVGMELSIQLWHSAAVVTGVHTVRFAISVHLRRAALTDSMGGFIRHGKNGMPRISIRAAMGQAWRANCCLWYPCAMRRGAAKLQKKRTAYTYTNAVSSVMRLEPRTSLIQLKPRYSHRFSRATWACLLTALVWYSMH